MEIFMENPKLTLMCACGGVALVSCATMVANDIHERRRLQFASFRKRVRESSMVQSNAQEEITGEELKVLDLSCPDLIETAMYDPDQIKTIISAYLHKACKVSQTTNCVTNALLLDPEQVKAELVSLNDRESRLLFGLPVSLKECINIKGVSTVIGLSDHVGNRNAKEDAVITKVLRYHGAIPYVKTNIPQTMLSFGSDNPVYGQTRNPLNLSFAPGGSSSGEGALIAAGGSLLGMGTDIAGSIRCPAHFCGLCGFKPTTGRVSKEGIIGVTKGQVLLNSNVGPLARDVDTCVLAMRALFSPIMYELDPNLAPIPFDQAEVKSKERLRIGYYADDGYMLPVPAVQRAVNITKQALEQAGHELVAFNVPRMEHAVDIINGGLWADGGRTWLKHLRFDRVAAAITDIYRKITYHPIVRKLISAYLFYQGQPRLAKDMLLSGGEDQSAARLWKLQYEAGNYKKEFFGKWKQLGIDVMICPAFPVVACPLASIEHMNVFWNYTVLYNLLNCPAGVVPVTKVTAYDVNKLQDYRGHYHDRWDAQVKKACEKSLGMPVAVQCVALPFRDEKCLRLMKEVEQCFSSGKK